MSNKETIKEVAENAWLNYEYKEDNLYSITFKNAFRLGAQYQAKTMYSEEEVRQLLLTQRGNSYVAILNKTKDKELAAIASGAPEPSGKDGWVKKQKNEQ